MDDFGPRRRHGFRYSWPNYSNRAELAREFYDKLSSSITGVPGKCAEVTIFLCNVPPSKVDFCVVVVARRPDPALRLTEEDFTKQLHSYFRTCGCPDFQSMESAPDSTTGLARAGLIIVEYTKMVDSKVERFKRGSA